MANCQHDLQACTPSIAAEEAGYQQPSRAERARAKGSVETFDDQDYPAPLVLYNDDIYLDAQYPPQDFKEWQESLTAQRVAKRRRTLYVVTPPGYTKDGLALRTDLRPKAPV